jgi:hypothetical protein
VVLRCMFANAMIPMLARANNARSASSNSMRRECSQREGVRLVEGNWQAQ